MEPHLDDLLAAHPLEPLDGPNTWPTRGDIEAQIAFEQAHGPTPPPDPRVLTPEDLQAIWNYAHIQQPLSQAAMQAFLDRHSPEDRARAEREAQLPWYAARWWYLQLSLREANRLGYLPHPELSFQHNPIALIAQARGHDAGVALARQWDFPIRMVPLGSRTAARLGVPFGTPVPQMEPTSMWDLMSTRRDGDAVIALIGDDRGYAPNWEYFIAVAWAPQAIATQTYGDPDHVPGLY